jgi:hypothetical protein
MIRDEASKTATALRRKRTVRSAIIYVDERKRKRRRKRRRRNLGWRHQQHKRLQISQSKKFAVTRRTATADEHDFP